MHRDARRLDDQATVSTSLCIVGAGAAGIPLALASASRGRDVMLLEGGGFDLDPALQDRYRGEVVGRPYYSLEATRLHYFGGTTGHWGGFCAPLDPVDFSSRSWVPGSGWPFAPETLEPWYTEAATLLELQPGGWAPSDAEETNAPLLPVSSDALGHKLWRFSPPTRFGSRYRNDVVRHHHIQLLTHAPVVSLRTTADGTALDHLVVRQPGGHTVRIRAQHFVLACSTLQNVRLLLSSNDHLPAGVGNAFDQVGRGFMEHLEMPVGTLALMRPQDMQRYAYDWGVTRERVELQLPVEVQRRYGLLNASFSLDPATAGSALVSTFDREPPDVLEAYRQDTRSGMTSELRAAALAERRAHDVNTVRRSPFFTVMTRQEQAPNAASRVTLSNDRDAWGVPRARLDWQLTALDLHSMREGTRALGRALGAAGVARLQLVDWLAADAPAWPERVSGGWHDMGGTRMHADPRKGVVDADCRVHGMANLWLAGAGVFPAGGAANPTLSIVALALRLANHLSATM